MFVLIHGGCHGAWCWERLRPLIESKGHRVIAPDLPAEVPDAGLRQSTDAALAAVGDTRAAPMIVVGHSLGGLVAPIVAEALKADHLVLLTAVYLVPGMSFVESQVRFPEMVRATPGGRTVDDAGCMSYSPQAARAAFFNTCDPSTTQWAVARLRRQTLTPFREVTPLTRWPEIPFTYVAAREDALINNHWAKQRCVDLGGQYLELPGDHSPFLTHERELAEILLSVAGDRS